MVDEINKKMEPQHDPAIRTSGKEPWRTPNKKDSAQGSIKIKVFHKFKIYQI
jgi:hypothetical protein